MVSKIDHQASAFQDWIVGQALALLDGNADPRQQFTGAEWLGEIIIGSRIQCLDDVIFRIPYRKNNDWFLIPFAEFFQDLISVKIR